MFSDVKASARWKWIGCLLLVPLAACSGSKTLTSTQPTPTSLSGVVSNSPATEAPATTAPVTAKGNPLGDICGVLTQGEVEPLLGQPITKVEPNNPLYKVLVSPSANCTYHSGTLGIVLVIAQPKVDPGSAAWKQAQTTFVSNIGAHSTIVPISGLGEWAEWFDNGKAAGGFAAAQYPYLVGVVVAGLLPSAPQAYQPELKQLTALVLGRVAP